MERLTTRSGFTNEVYLTGKADVCWADRPIEERAFCVGCRRHKGMDRTNCGALMLVDRLAAYEDTGLEPEEIISAVDMAKVACALEELNAYKELGSLDRLRELAEADRLIGMAVFEPNKRGFISTYEIISVHISKCSILVGWNLLDGVYSNLNGFEISALGKTVFLTREEAEAALAKEGT